MPLLTLNPGTTYNLYDVLNGTTAGASHTVSQESLVSRLIIKNVSSGSEIAYLARNYASVDATHYDVKLAAGDAMSDAFHEEGNSINLREFSIRVSVNSTLLAVYTSPF